MIDDYNEFCFNISDIIKEKEDYIKSTKNYEINSKTNESSLNINYLLYSTLKSRGWAILTIDQIEIKKYFIDIENIALNNWENVFRKGFLLSQDIKDEESQKYRSERGVALGYRKEDTREFFETRIDNIGEVIPCFHFKNDVNLYKDSVIGLNSAMNKIGGIVLSSIFNSMGLDEASILDLTDIASPYNENVC
jgi:hypothetical protein